jgi:GNAT superfamily N-acetyltransferase
MKVQRIESGDWREWKASRLQALADSPEAFASSFAAEKKKPDEAWSEYARHCGASPASAAFLARDEQGRVTGMVAAYVDGGESANATICAMWVAPESRNRGVGRLLVDEAARWLMGTGASEVKACTNPSASRRRVTDNRLLPARQSMSGFMSSDVDLRGPPRDGYSVSVNILMQF